jgi:hypothetical protein
MAGRLWTILLNFRSCAQQFETAVKLKQAVTPWPYTLEKNSFCAGIQAFMPQWANDEMPVIMCGGKSVSSYHVLGITLFVTFIVHTLLLC